MVPKPQHTYAVRGKTARALLVAGMPWRGVVLGSVNLNRQFHSGTIKIQHETCEGVLLAKAETVELFTTEAVPQTLLRVGHMLAQVTRGLQEGRRDRGGSPYVRDLPPPSLPPLGGGIGNCVCGILESPCHVVRSASRKRILDDKALDALAVLQSLAVEAGAAGSRAAAMIRTSQKP
jgi:hypothetical protein